MGGGGVYGVVEEAGLVLRGRCVGVLEEGVAVGRAEDGLVGALLLSLL